MSMNKAQIDLVKATAGVVGEHALAITSVFYPRMLKANPEVLQYFNRSNQRNARQPKALADAVAAYGANIDNLSVLGEAVGMMVHKHVALGVPADAYGVVHDHLMAAVGEVLGDAATPEIGGAWSAAVMQLAGLLIDAEAKMTNELAELPGGWRGRRAFRVAERHDAGTLAHLRLEPVDGGKVMAVDAGKYLTLHIDEKTLAPDGDEPHIAPRHYSVVASDDCGLEVCVRRVEGGRYSTFLHEHAAPGFEVMVAPPVGVFTRPAGGNGKRVYIAGGVGLTPLAAMAKEGARARDERAVFVHATSVEHDATMALELLKVDGRLACEFHEVRGEPGTAPAMDSVVECIRTTLGADWMDAQVLTCGPKPMMEFVCSDLLRRGVDRKNFFYEAFGPHFSM